VDENSITWLVLAAGATPTSILIWRGLPPTVKRQARDAVTAARGFARPGTPSCKTMADRIWSPFRRHVDDSLGPDRVVAPEAVRVAASPDDGRFLLRNRLAIVEELGLRCARHGWELAPRLDVVIDRRRADGRLAVAPLWAEEHTDGAPEGAQAGTASTQPVPLLTHRGTGEERRVVRGLSIGRGSWNDWELPADDRTVSREGVRLEQGPRGWQVLVDARCRTRVFVDGQLVPAGTARAVVDGDLTVGPHEFVFSADGVGGTQRAVG
jgi:hypothetical protein